MGFRYVRAQWLHCIRWTRNMARGLYLLFSICPSYWPWMSHENAGARNKKKITPLCRSTLRTPENNVVKCIKGKNAKKEKVGAPAKTNSIILNRRDGVPRIFAKPRSASFHTARFDLKFTLTFKICPFAKLRQGQLQIWTEHCQPDLWKSETSREIKKLY